MTLAVPSYLPYPLWNSENTSDHELRSCHGSALARLGFTLFHESCYAEAIEALSQALSLDPHSLSIRQWRAACNLQLGNYDRTLADLEAVVSQDPTQANGYNNRAMCYALLGRMSSALEDLNRAIELNPKYVLAYANKAHIHCALGQYAQAQQACSTGMLLDATNEELLNAQRLILDGLFSLA